jgi:membrane-bound metal-dependent hydrolase YbcI (DUF457 family)
MCSATAARPLACAAAIAAAVYASRLPDVDEPGARIHRRTRLERRHFLAATLGTVLRAPLWLLSLAPHRGFTHWLTTGALVAVACGALAALVMPVLSVPVMLGVACGYLAHTLADACTPSGAPLLGPFSMRRVHLLPRRLRIVTGGPGDTAVMLAALAAATLVAYSQVA